jgi:hypothetical protein
MLFSPSVNVREIQGHFECVASHAFFHRSTKRGEQSQSKYQKIYDEGIQVAVKYFGE